MRTKEQWIELMHQQDEKVGVVEGTLDEEYKEKRLRRIEKFNEKTDAIVDYLIEHEEKFVLCQMIVTKKMHTKLTTDIYIPKGNIVFRHEQSDDEVSTSYNDVYFKFMRYNFLPFFIRTNETLKFTLMKTKNILELRKVRTKEGFKRVKFIPVVKKKRARIHGVRIEHR